MIGELVIVEQKRVFARKAIEEEDIAFDFLAAKGERHRGGCAEGVAVGARVGGDEHPATGGEYVENPAIGIGHGWISHG